MKKNQMKTNENWFNLLLLIVMICSISFAGCKKDAVHSSLFPDGSKPSPLISASVENLPGAAKITYSLPADNSILYVKADYEIRPGVKREVKSSYYTNYLVVDGFGDSSVHDVQLSVINRSDLESTPITVKVQPHTPPVLGIFQSLNVFPDFGGVNINFKNPTGADISLVVLAQDSTGKMVVNNIKYTNADSLSYSIRGFDSTKRKFGFYVKDSYGNYSDTLYNYYSPYYEVLLDKSKFQEVDLPGDVGDDWGLPMSNLWDGVIAVGDGGYSNIFHTQSVPFPMWFTFDLGVKVKLSRITLWQRQDPPEEWIYAANNPKHFQVWGCSDAFPDPSGDWDDWSLLVDREIIKPSGLPMGQVSQADLDAAAQGEEMNVPLDMPPVRYIRIKILETWTNVATNIAEVSFWGQP